MEFFKDFSFYLVFNFDSKVKKNYWFVLWLDRSEVGYWVEDYENSFIVFMEYIGWILECMIFDYLYIIAFFIFIGRRIYKFRVDIFVGIFLRIFLLFFFENKVVEVNFVVLGDRIFDLINWNC